MTSGEKGVDTRPLYARSRIILEVDRIARAGNLDSKGSSGGLMQVTAKQRMRAAVVGVAALALVLTGCAGASGSISYAGPAQVDGALPQETQAQLNDAVTHAMAASGASGAIVGVWAPWSGSWVTGLGTQTVDGATAVDAEMSFRVGDVTRLMTCDVLYALADRDILELDDPVTKYVSGVADLSSVTLVHLCNGTGGLGSSAAVVGPSMLNTPNRAWNPKELASFGLERSRLAPGLQYQESDAGYLLLGLAMERASGKKMEELIDEYVAEPLDLDSTKLPGSAPGTPGDAPLNGHFLLPAEEGGMNCAAPVDITTSSASAGFSNAGAVSTITDLGRYAQAEAVQALRIREKPQRYAEAMPAYADAPSWLQATGGGFMVGSMIGQHGWAPGYLTAAYSDPTTGFTVAVVLNNSAAGKDLIAALAWELAAIASKAPAAAGQTAPEFGLPFTAEQYREQVTALAVCPIAPSADETAPVEGEEEEG